MGHVSSAVREPREMDTGAHLSVINVFFFLNHIVCVCVMEENFWEPVLSSSVVDS